MKMMRKNWKDRKGVSPVIATILMVAITVVLAAVLYVMVMGFGGDSSSTPAGQITKVEEMKVGEVAVYKLSLSSFSPETKFTDLKFSGVNYDDIAEFDSDVEAGTIYYVDLGDDETVSQGDYIYIVEANVPGGSVSIVHGPSGGLIAEKAVPKAA